MAKQVALTAQMRDGLGKEKAKKLRVKGLIPAEFYGKQVKDNIHLVVNHREFEKAVKSSESRFNALFNLKIQDASGKEKEELVFLREYQQDPISDKFVHLDFLKIDTKVPILIKVHVKLVGECPAVKAGLVLAQAIHELPIKVLPLEIPAHISIDITKLEKAHDAVRVSDLKLPGITIELPAGQEIVHAEVPRELKVESETPVAETAEVPTTAQTKPEDAPAGEPGKPGAKPEAAKGAAPAAGAAKPGEAKPAAGKPEAKKPEAKK